jgi:hypothetical protein
MGATADGVMITGLNWHLTPAVLIREPGRRA